MKTNINIYLFKNIFFSILLITCLQLFYSSYVIYGQLLKTEPLAAYRVGGEWTIIDRSGQKLFSSNTILDIEQYSDGLFGTYIFEGDKVISAYYNINGKIVVRSNSRKPYSFKNGRAFVVQVADSAKHEYLFGCINKKGKYIVPMKYIDMEEYSEGLAYIMNLDDRGYIDTNGKFVFKLEKGFAGYGFREGISPISNSKLNKFGFVDRKGKLVIDYKFDEVGHFSEGLCKAYQANEAGKGAFGFINKSGHYVIKNEYDETSSFSEGRAFVAVLDPTNTVFMWSVINSDGILLSTFQFKDYKNYSEGIASVMNEKILWRYIDRNVKYIDSVEYKYCGSFKNDKAFVVTADDKKMFITRDGKAILEIPADASVVLDCRTNEKYDYRKQQ